MVRYLFIVCFFYFHLVSSQEIPFHIRLEPVMIEGLTGIQSFAWAQYGGKWLIIGGRKDGLHRRQPFGAFNMAGQQDDLWVVDPVAKQVWKRSVNELPSPVRDQFRSTNMQFYQSGNSLILTGGYGIDSSTGNHTTFPFLTHILVKELMEAILFDTPLSSCIQQITDERFRVTGGDLKKIGDIYYLVGGHSFIGRYNPTGPAHGPGFVQEYTDAVRLFTLRDEAGRVGIDTFFTWKDARYFHRRDLNVVACLDGEGKPCFTVFSGVFRPEADIPFRDCIHVNESGYTPQSDFEQLLNHYHCATVPLFDSLTGDMHTLFFGGIAQFYMQGGQVVNDVQVPFVRTISKVTRKADSTMSEMVMPGLMPGYTGTGAQFIVSPDVKIHNNGVLDYRNIKNATHIGYIMGGINSSAPNIFFSNDGTQSEASSMVYRVFWEWDTSVSNEDGSSHLLEGIRFVSSPGGQFVYVSLPPGLWEDLHWILYTADGRQVMDGQWQPNGDNGRIEIIETPAALLQGLYFFRISLKTSIRTFPITIVH